MKVYKVELLIIDHDNVGEEGIREVLENESYPNHCIAPRVKNIEGRDIGEWTDEHPLNKRSTAEVFYKNLFGSTPNRKRGIR
jgi:hypothetical protein